MRSPWLPRRTASNTSTANRAPMGSMTIPSQRRILSTSRTGRMTLSMGATTVGPVTTSTAPSTMATRQSSPSNQ
ncbi:hypothetical protein D3C85_1789920 [compost metagenome]